MKLSANLIKSFNSINSFTFGDWSIRANEPNSLYFQLTDLDQQPYCNSTQSTCNNALRYLTGQGVGTTPVVVKVLFPAIDCNTDALEITADTVSAADPSLFKVDLTDLEVPGGGNLIFSVQEGSVTRKFYLQDGISVEDPSSLGKC